MAGRPRVVDRADPPRGPRAGARRIPRGVRDPEALRLRIPHAAPRRPHRLVARRGAALPGRRGERPLRARLRGGHHGAAADGRNAPLPHSPRPPHRPSQPDAAAGAAGGGVDPGARRGAAGGAAAHEPGPLPRDPQHPGRRRRRHHRSRAGAARRRRAGRAEPRGPLEGRRVRRRPARGGRAPRPAGGLRDPEIAGVAGGGGEAAHRAHHQHRHRGRTGPWRHRGAAPPPRRYGPRGRPPQRQRLRGLRSRARPLRPGSAGAAGRAAAGDRGGRADSPLPAEGGPQVPDDHGHGGARALAPPQARHAPPRTLHPAGRAGRADQGPHAMGPGRRGRAVPRLAATGPRSPRRGEPLCPQPPGRPARGRHHGRSWTRTRCPRTSCVSS